jgi:hypothetical protein
MIGLGKMILAVGLILVAVGALMMLGDKIPFLGRLPGDTVVQRPGFRFYFPLGTSVLLSVLLSLILWFLNR